MLRDHSVIGLADAKAQVELWAVTGVPKDAPPSAGPAGPAAALPGGTGAVLPADGPTPTSRDQLAVEARAIMKASGWHTAEAYLRSEHGLGPDEARAVLDSLQP